MTTELETLLALQEHDGALDRLFHRHQTLPEREALQTAESERGHDRRPARHDAAPSATASHATSRRSTTKRSSLAAKAVEVEGRMYSGEVSSPEELQAMQSDVEQLRRHQRSIGEPRARAHGGARAARRRRWPSSTQQRADADGRARSGPAALAEAEAVVIAEMQVERAARDQVAAGIDDALVKEYERCRALAQGPGVARLVGTTCQGCHLSIPAIEAERIKTLGRAARSPTATTAARSWSPDARAGARLLRRWLARQSRAGRDRRGRARPVERRHRARLAAVSERIGVDHQQRRRVPRADRRTRSRRGHTGAGRAACGATRSS